MVSTKWYTRPAKVTFKRILAKRRRKGYLALGAAYIGGWVPTVVMTDRA